MKQRQTAIAAFITHKMAIDRALERLQQLSNNHFNVHPEEINWGHVGDLANLDNLLKEVTNQAFKEGEYQ